MRRAAGSFARRARGIGNGLAPTSRLSRDRSRDPRPHRALATQRLDRSAGAHRHALCGAARIPRRRYRHSRPSRWRSRGGGLPLGHSSFLGILNGRIQSGCGDPVHAARSDPHARALARTRPDGRTDDIIRRRLRCGHRGSRGARACAGTVASTAARITRSRRSRGLDRVAER